MWRVAKVCPTCLEAEFDKDEDGSLICVGCDEIYEDAGLLEDMEYMD